jgi:hypothetical protein
MKLAEAFKHLRNRMIRHSNCIAETESGWFHTHETKTVRARIKEIDAEIKRLESKDNA